MHAHACTGSPYKAPTSLFKTPRGLLQLPSFLCPLRKTGRGGTVKVSGDLSLTISKFSSSKSMVDVYVCEPVSVCDGWHLAEH